MSDSPAVAPYLTVSSAFAATAFHASVFGVTQRALMPSLDGLRIMHCELLINGGSLFLADMFPEFGNCRVPILSDPATVSVSLEFATPQEVDDTFERATNLGAKPETVPTDSFWGTRYAALRDPFGHRWLLNGILSNQ